MFKKVGYDEPKSPKHTLESINTMPDPWLCTHYNLVCKRIANVYLQTFVLARSFSDLVDLMKISNPNIITNYIPFYGNVRGTVFYWVRRKRKAYLFSDLPPFLSYNYCHLEAMEEYWLIYLEIYETLG